MSQITVGFIGAGQIGEPMIERLLAHGFSTSVFARRKEARERLRLGGATVVDDPQRLAINDVVVACLFDDRQLFESCASIVGALKEDAVFISHTTGSPETTMRLQAIAEGRGAHVIEAPFSGTAQAISRGELTVMLSGDRAAFDTARVVLAAYSDKVIETGPVGTALEMKLLNNALFAACTQVTLSALNIARSLGISDECFFEVLSVSSGGSTAAEKIIGSGVPSDVYAEHLLRYLCKDVATVRTVADEVGIDIEGLVGAMRSGPMELLA